MIDPYQLLEQSHFYLSRDYSLYEFSDHGQQGRPKTAQLEKRRDSTQIKIVGFTGILAVVALGTWFCLL